MSNDQPRPRRHATVAPGPTAERRTATAAGADTDGAPAAATTAGLTPWHADARGLLSDCDRSARYHTARRAFFDAWHRWMMVGVLISGSAAAASLNAGLGTAWATVLALIPAVVGAVSVVWNLTHTARDHELLARRFYDLAKRIVVHEANAATVDRWRAEMLDLWGDEPATYHALNAECHNAVAQAIGADTGAVEWRPQNRLDGAVRIQQGEAHSSSTPPSSFAARLRSRPAACFPACCARSSTVSSAAIRAR